MPVHVFNFLYFCSDTDLKLNQISESFTQWLHQVTYVKITSNPFPWPGLEPTMVSKDEFLTVLTTFTEIFQNPGLCAQMFALHTLPTTLLTHLLSVSAESTEEHSSRVTFKTGLILDPVERLGCLFDLNDSCWCLSREMSVFRNL